MNTVVTTNKTQNQIQEFQKTLVSNKRKFESTLPSHITPEKFMRTIVTAVQSNPKLLNCTHESIIKSALHCAKDGLLPDGREAAFVQFGSDAQYIPMYQGLLKRIRNSGLIYTIDAQIIYEKDYFKWTQGTKPDIEHKPFFPGDRGAMIGVYAVAFYKNTQEKQFIVLGKDEIDEIKKIKNNKIWTSHYEAMAQKTALRRLSKFLPMDADIFDEPSPIEDNQNTIIYEDCSKQNDEPVQKAETQSSKLSAFNQRTHVEDVPQNQFDDGQGVVQHVV